MSTKDFTNKVVEQARELVKEKNLFVTKTKWKRVKESDVEYLLLSKDSDYISTKPCLVPAKKSKKREKKNVARDPFLPYEKPLEVIENLFESHALLHNKFQLLGKQLLLITKNFEPQVGHLTHSDFKSILHLYHGILKDEADEWVFFYNRGKKSGCSQPHKHVQIIKVTDDEGKIRLPNHRNLVSGEKLEDIWRFVYRYCQFTSFDDLNDNLEKKYNEFLKDLKIDENLRSEDSDKVTVMTGKEEEKKMETVDFNVDSYSLIISNRYLLVIPRRSESYEDTVYCNCLTFFHSFYFRNDELEKKVVEDISFKSVLEAITFPL